MELADFIDQVEGFEQSSPREKIRVLAWYLHAHGGREIFESSHIRDCFGALHLAAPNVSQYLTRMLDHKDLVKVRGGYKLERAHRTTLDAQYGIHQSVVQVSKLLSDLPNRVPNLGEKNFLQEALNCYRIGAYRACIVMVWNLSYSHVLHWLLSDMQRLTAFNAGITRRYPKRAGVQIAKYEEFLDEFKEAEVIEILNTTGLLNSNVVKILREKLGRRNTAAHPAAVVMVQSQADDMVTDLVNNVVLALP